MSLRAAAVARGIVGGAMVARPDRIAAALGAQAAGGHPVLRLLGARNLAEATGLLLWPTEAAASVARAVDLAHITSCLGLAAASVSHRRQALRDAALASALLTLTELSRPTRRT